MAEHFRELISSNERVDLPKRSASPGGFWSALAVKILRAAGCVVIAKTNMAEFAFTGIGLNPHYGTPGNPADRTRMPGGSSSG